MQKKILIAVSVCIAAAIIGAVILLPDTEKSEKTDFLMNTVVSLKLEGEGSEKTAQEILDKTQQLENACLSRTAEGSDIYRLNCERKVILDSETADILNRTLEVCRRSGGAFDITLARVSDLWNDSAVSKKIPDCAILDEAVKASGYENLTVTENTAQLNGSTTVDLGSAGKGAACDSAKLLLEESGVSRAVVSVGGSILLYGEGDFTVGIASPERGSTDYIATLDMQEGFVSTSGTYERYFDLDSKRYHHILDPETGYPVDNGLVSVTVCSQDGLLSDALSTACFVLGIEKGTALARSYGCETVFVTEEKEIIVSDGIADCVKITDSTYSLV